MNILINNKMYDIVINGSKYKICNNAKTLPPDPPSENGFNITTLAFENATTPLTIPNELKVIEGKEDVVHPSTLYFENGWNGYKYWMAINPYPNTNSAYENPCMIVSNDGDNWITKGAVPIYGRTQGATHNSDCHIFMDKDNITMHYINRMAFNGDATSVIEIFSSKDGVLWTERRNILDRNSEFDYLSPSICYFNNKYYMFAFNNKSNDKTLISVLESGSVYGEWKKINDIKVPFNYTIWHLEVKLINNEFVVLLQQGSAQGGVLFLGKFKTPMDTHIELRRTPVLGGIGSDWQSAIYKSSFNLNKDDMDIFVGSKSPRLDSTTYWRISRVKAKRVSPTLNTSQNNIIYEDNFNSFIGWSKSAAAITATVNNNVLDLTSSTGGFIYRNVNLSNFIFESNIEFLEEGTSSTSRTGIIFRYKNNTQYYGFGYVQTGSMPVLYQSVSGNITKFSRSGLSPYDGCKISIICDGSLIKAYIDDMLACEIEDNLFVGDGTDPKNIGYATVGKGKFSKCKVFDTEKKPPENIPVTTITINNKISSLTQNNTHQLQVNVLPSNATDRTLTYTSSNTSIATVSTTGLINAIGLGTCTIAVKSNNNISDTMNLTVNSAIINVTGVIVSPTSGTLYPNQTTKLTTTVLPSNATNKNVTWTSLNTSIATVDSNGNVTAKAIGSTTIRCATVDGGFTSDYSLSVMEQSVNPPSEDIVYENPTYGDKVLTLDGRILTVSKLFDEDSPYYNSAQAKDEVTYNSDEQRYYLTKRVGVTRTVDINFTSTATNSYIQLLDENGIIYHKVVWSTTNTSVSYGANLEDDRVMPTGRDGAVASDKIGIVAYNTTGNFYIKNPNSIDVATVSNILSNKTIRYVLVEEELNIPLAKETDVIHVSSIKLNKTIIGLNESNVNQLSYVLKPVTATNKNVSWASSDISVATVDNQGNITATGNGQAKITVTTQDGMLTSTTNVIVSEPYTEEQLFNGAYVQMYYYEPKINLGTDLIIPFYISDEEQTEFYTDDYSKRFTLIVTIDDVERRFTGLQAGDQDVNLGKLTEGEHSVVFQGLDESTGAKGMAIYKEVWVVNPATYPITEAQTYHMTEGDLVDFGINNKNSTVEADMNNNIIGLNNMFKFYKNKGIRKIVMLPGTYRVKNTVETGKDRRQNVITFLSNMDYDLNGATFKFEPALDITQQGVDADYGATIIAWKDVVDTHVYNGILEGDRVERNAAGLEGASKGGEALNAMYLIGGRYSSITNLEVNQISGHATMNLGGSATGFMLPKYTFDEFKPSIIDSTNNTNGKFFILNGEIVNGDYYYTSGMQDLKTWKSSYVIFGNDSGYSWFRGLSNYVYFHFYDEDGDFVTTIASMQYRPVMIPYGCRFVRYSIKSFVPDFEGGTLFYKEQGTHLSFSNNLFNDCRTTAYAPTCSRGLLMEKNNYINCGHRITASSLDFEDGWQQSIDVFYRDNDCTGSVLSSADLITVCGVNHVYENNRNHGIFGKHYMAGCVYRNCNNDLWLKMGMSYDHESRYNRIYNCNGNLQISQWIGEFGDTELSRKEKHAYLGVNGGSYTGDYPGGYKKYNSEPNYPNNKIRNADLRGGGKNTWMVKCNIYPQPYLGENLFFEECNFYNFDDINTQIKFSFNAENAVREFINCHFKSPVWLANHNKFNSGKFERCEFEKATTIYPNTANIKGDIVFNNCTFKELTTINIGNAGCYIVFNNCTFEKGKSFLGSGQANSEFNNCIG